MAGGASSSGGRMPVDGVTIQYNSSGKAAVPAGAFPPGYNASTPSTPASGSVLAQGYAPVRCVQGATNPRRENLGFLGHSGSGTPIRTVGYLNGINAGATTGMPGAARGKTCSWKGFFKARSAAKIDASFEPVGFGIMFSTAALDEACFGHSTETTRDDRAGLCAIINATNDVKYYNHDDAGDASYLDPTGGALQVNPTTGFTWEIIIATPAAGDTTEDSTVTLKINGTTIFSGATVRAIADDLIPQLMLNCDGEFSQVLFEVKET